jgi:DNA-binding SARP family transcriptional activator/WD40 repeat protein/class 3 adenylate cyclase
VNTGSGPAVSTWTVLFTDIVASTTTRVRVGEDAFDAVRAEHDRLTLEVVAAHGGSVVKHTGDGVMAVFGGASDALSCAASLERTLERRNRLAQHRVDVRAGLSIGDAIVQDDDLHGLAVVEARRLCDAAQSGEVLCNDLVRVAAGSRGGHSFGPSRLIALKGLAGDLRCSPLVWSDEGASPKDASDATSLSVLGPLSVQRNGATVPIGGRKEQSVLATLLAAEGEQVSIDALIDAVWMDTPPRSAARTTHAYIARLRRALPTGWLVTQGRAYSLTIPRANLDASRFADSVRAGRTLLAQGDPGAAVVAFSTALELWHGRAFEEHDDIERCANAGRALEELRRNASEDRFDALLALGEARDLVPALESAVAAEPLRERLWGQLMLALYRSGRQADALRAYQRVRQILVDELGLEPGAPLRQLENAILTQDDDRLRGTSDTREPRVALPLALDAAGAALIGRDDELSHLVDAWTAAKNGHGVLVSIVGAEGIGKTRLASELARRANDDGAVILYAQSDAAHRTPRALFDQALRSAGSSLMRAQSDAVPAEPLGTSIARRLSGWSQARPVLVVLDDLHRADGEVLEVVAQVAGASTGAHILVIGIFRTDLGESASRADVGDQYIALEGLDTTGVARICALYGDAWTTAEAGAVRQSTGGVPLAVHEEANALARDAAARRLGEAAVQATAAEFRLSASQEAVTDEVVGIQRIVEQRRLQLGSRAAPARVCPFKGLSHFDVEDAEWFFGRERLVAEMAAHLVSRPVLAVVGASGSGKSSLVRAGLVPALADGALPGSARWRVALGSPGALPADELQRLVVEAGGTDAPDRLLVVVDQLEELFTLCADDEQRARFGANLRELVDEGAGVVVTLRADQIGRMTEVPDVAALLGGNDVLVGPLRERELRDAIVRPAQRAGLELEDGLVEDILEDAHGAPGVLPLMQTALLETWIRRDGRRLTVVGYHDSGGVHGAVARVAETVYDRLTPPQRDAARRILLRLAEPSEDGTFDLRRRVPIDELTNRDDKDASIACELMVQHRLLTTSGNTVEVAHEALLREWPRLRRWLEDDVDGRRVHRRLAAAARAWAASDRDQAELLRGTRLDASADWANSHDADLNDIERAFLNASAREAEREVQEAHLRADTEARTSRRLRRLLIGVALLLVVALGVGALAAAQRRRANEATASERVAATAADARRLGAQALVDDQLDRALLSAVAAVRLDDSPDTRAELLATLQRAPHAREVHRETGARLVTLALSPDQRQVAIRDTAGIIHLYDANSLSPVTTIDPQAGSGAPAPESHGAVWLPDGTLAFSRRDARGLGLTVVDPAHPSHELRRFEAAGDGTDSIAVDPHGRTLAVTAAGRGGVTAFAWDTKRPQTPSFIRALGPSPNSQAAVTPDGRAIAVALWDRVALLDARTGSPLATYGGQWFVDISPDGQSLATRIDRGARAGAARFSSVAVYDLRTGALRFTVDVQAVVNAARFSSDGSLLLTAGSHSVTAWDARTGVQRLALRGHASDAQAITTSADGQTAYSISFDGMVIEWDLTERHSLFRRLDTLTPKITSSLIPTGWSIAPDGDVYLVVGDRILRRDYTTGRLSTSDEILTNQRSRAVVDLPIPDVRRAPHFSPDATTLAVGGGDGSIQLWNRGTRQRIAEWRDPKRRPITAVTFSPDGSLIAADTYGSADAANAAVWLLDAHNLRPIGTPIAIANAGRSGIAQVAFSATSTQIAIVHAKDDQPAFVSIRDARTGRERWRRPTPVNAITATFSPDGKRLALGALDGMIAVVNAADGRTVAAPVSAHEGFAWEVFYMPDGRLLGSAGADGKVRMWRADNLEPAGTFDPGEGTIPNGIVALSTTKGRLLFASGDGRVWNIPSDLHAWINRACSIAARDITRDEWTRLVPNRRYQHVCGRT